MNHLSKHEVNIVRRTDERGIYYQQVFVSECRLASVLASTSIEPAY